jgi:putative salt-induced outer membrane protein YdiY
MWSAFALTGLLIAHARAAESTFSGTPTPDKPGTSATTLRGELGGSWISGNARSYTVTSALQATHRWKKSRASIALGANLGRTAVDADGNGRIDADERDAPGSETARRYSAEVRYDRLFAPKDSAYGLAGVGVDPFAGYELRSHAQVGWSHTFRPGPSFGLIVEAGADGARELLVEGVEPGEQWIWAARVMGRATHAFNPSVSGELQVEALDNVLSPADLRVLGTGAIVARLDSRIAL